MDSLTLIIITLFVVALALIIGILNFIQNQKKRKLKRVLEELEYEKNQIDSTPIMPELAKIETFLKNEKLGTMYQEWKDRYENLKNVQLPKITDMLLEADYSLSQTDYKSTLYKIAKLEMELYRVRISAEFLLNEIKEITSSEEKNRAIVTNLKVNYRKLYQQFTSTQDSFGIMRETVNRYFESIARCFEKFEDAMEHNEYTEVTQIIKSINEMLKHMEVVIEEVPNIVLLATNILPKKMNEIYNIYKQMVKVGFPLDYLNVEYNIDEAKKKINDVVNRCKELNLEDSLFELKVLLDYFDSLYNDFDKEQRNRDNYEQLNRDFKAKLEKSTVLINDIFNKMEEIQKAYHLSKDDINVLVKIKGEIAKLNEDYKLFLNHTNNNTFAYSKLISEVEGLMVKLTAAEEELEGTLDIIGTMREDEVRARQQLEEVKQILKDSKTKIREYNLPVIPKHYYVQLNEAMAAIKEIVKELDRKPITIDILNTRVDTARDLVLKLYSTTKEMMKTAMFAEMAIVYGNRYRTNTDELDKNLTYSEVLFFKGEYQKSLEMSINALNRVETGIYDKLLNLYGGQNETA